MKFLTRYAANDNKNNISAKIREKRIKIFISYLKKVNFPEPINILDVGGTNYFWDLWKEKIQFQINLTLLNINPEATKDYNSIMLDANYLEKIKENSFDIVFSNSLIEHLGSWENQVKFSKEVKRISKHFFIQTPSYIFPLEPHFLFPFFHWLPLKFKIIIHQNLDLGWYKKEKDFLTAKQNIEEIRILKKKELQTLFPNSRITNEKLFGLTKSYLVSR